MTQTEPTNASHAKQTKPAETYTKTLLYDGVRQGKISKKHLEAFQKNLGALLTKQMSRCPQNKTSVKKATAQNFTTSIFYCIDTVLSNVEDSSLALEKLQDTTLQNLFKEGLTQLNQEFNQARLLYSRMKGNKLDVDVQIYNTTINESIPLFFKAYNLEFGADVVPGTLSYLPVYYQKNLAGIHYMKDIINNLYLENHFCKQFDLAEVKDLLNIFGQKINHPSVDLTENLFGLILNNAVAKNLLNSEDNTLILTEPEAFKFFEIFKNQSRKVCKEAVHDAVEAILIQKSLRWPSLKIYLEKAQEKTVASLYRSTKQETLSASFSVC